MHHSSLRELAIRLRKSGYSYPYISNRTRISKSTLSGWLSTIPYTPNKETVHLLGKARAAAGERKAKMRQAKWEATQKEAAKEVGNVSKRDLFMLGLGLYLGEGSKTHSLVNIANADPRVIRLAIAWFRNMGIEMHQFAPRVHIYPDSNIKACVTFWSKNSGIPQHQFQKTYIDIRPNKKYKRRGKLPFGTLYVSIRSRGKKEHGVTLFRKIQAWNDSVLEKIKNAGIV